MHYLICGNYGAHNIGDQAILIGLLTKLTKENASSTFTVMCHDKKSVQKDLTDFGFKSVTCIDLVPTGFRSLFKTDYAKLIKHIKKADLAIIGGGGLFTDKETKRAAFIWYIQAACISFFNVPIEMRGQSVGPLNSTIAKAYTKYAYAKAKKATVRDESSKEILASLKVLPKVSIEDDFALHVEIPKNGAQKNVDFVEKKYAVVSMKWLDRVNFEYELEVVKFFDELIKQGFYIYLKPMGTGAISDKAYMNRLLLQYKLSSKNVRVHNDNSLLSSIKLYAHAEFVIGMRLHSIIFSVLTRTKVIALNYHSKVKNFITTKKLDIPVIEISEISAGKLKKELKKLKVF